MVRPEELETSAQAAATDSGRVEPAGASPAPRSELRQWIFDHRQLRLEFERHGVVVELLLVLDYVQLI